MGVGLAIAGTVLILGTCFLVGTVVTMSALDFLKQTEEGEM